MKFAVRIASVEYLGPCQKSMIEFFTKIVNGQTMLTCFVKIAPPERCLVWS